VSLPLTLETLRLPLGNPFRIARSEHGGGREIPTGVGELSDVRFAGIG
jgi:hypothetical protein